MTCSKIFSGDLPELISEIIQYFQNDFSTLHSCILVNRLWCRLAIPFLWEDPFSIPTQNYHFIEIYLHNLNDDDKTKLSEYGINVNLFPSNTLFNYPSFIKYLNTRNVLRSIEYLIESLSMKNYISFTNSVRLIFKSLSKIFIENKANVHTFEISCSYYTSMENYLSQIINSHQNLKKILFDDFPLYHSLLSLKNSNCLNTLKTIVFHRINFKNIINLNEVFEQLNVLESIHILYCYSLNSDFIRQIINITKPFKLKSLFMNEALFQVDVFQLLLQKFGNYLENIGFESSIRNELKQQLFRLIQKYCTKINFFDLYGFDNQNIRLVFDLIKNAKQNLNCLSINFCTFHNFDNDQLNNDTELSSIVLLNLGQILPSKLEYLSLSLKFNPSDFKIFLINSQNTFIKKLLIRNKICDEGEVILPYIKEYVMKKKRVKHLAIKEVFFSQFRDLFFLKDEVKEFELYDIEVRKDEDLNLDFYDFIKK